MLNLVNDLILSGTLDNFVAGNFGDNISKLIQNIIGPIFLAVMGVIAITFLIQRQIMQFVIFLVIGILVAALIYVPNMIKGLGEGVGQEVKWN